MTQNQANFLALAAGDSGAPEIVQAAMGAASIGQAELKSTTGEVSTSSSSLVDLTLPGGEYGFSPQLKETGDGLFAHLASGPSELGTTYVTNIALARNTSGTAYAQQRYIQTSPPYKIGDMLWGHFLFVLRNIATGEIIASYQAEDPPWAYNGNPNYGKDDVRRIQEVPHPFADYWIKNPSIDGLEIVLLDLREFDMAKFKSDSAKINKSPLENMEGNIIISPTKKPLAAIGIPEIIGFTDKVVFR